MHREEEEEKKGEEMAGQLKRSRHGCNFTKCPGPQVLFTSCVHVCGVKSLDTRDTECVTACGQVIS